MKKKLFIASLIIIAIFITFLVFSLLLSKKQAPAPSPSPDGQEQFLNLEKSDQQTQDDLDFGQTIDKLIQQFPWYSQLPIVTEEFTIAFNFDKNSFRIILLKPTTEEIKQSALDKLTDISVDLNEFQYYFIDANPGSGFQQLLP